DIDNAMAVHNWARNVVNVPNLSWDKGLQASAQAYADKLADKVGVLEHSRAGENLFWSSVMGSNDLRDASQSWANEVANYHYEIIPNGDFNGYGHYTQVVWRSTQRVGIGASRDPKGGVYIVAHYDPVGN
ncbi:PR-1-like protein, partial [Thozetella sp. PMI_491]